MRTPLSIPIGLDITEGLDGDDIHHLMSPEGWHMTIIGPKEERSAFRDSFVRSVRSTGECDIIEVGEGQDSIDVVMDEMHARTNSDRDDVRRLLVVVRVDATEEARTHARTLLSMGRAAGVTVCMEFASYANSMGVPHAAANSWTTIYLGPESELWVQSRTGSLVDFRTGEYVVQQSRSGVRSVVLA